LYLVNSFLFLEVEKDSLQDALSRALCRRSMVALDDSDEDEDYSDDDWGDDDEFGGGGGSGGSRYYGM